MNSIAAIVVTYNRVNLLVCAIDGIQQQSQKPDCIIVVDNASTDQTSAVVNDLVAKSMVPIRYIRLQENTGGAGGFYVGLKAGYESGFDMFWLMDDDTIPDNDALSELLKDYHYFKEVRGAEPAFVCSTVLWKNEDICEMNIPKPAWDWLRPLTPNCKGALVESASFVSIIFSRAKVRKLGYPIKEFFIWYDDVEYTSRLALDGQPGFLSIGSKVHHYLDVNQGVNFTLLTNQNVWKFCHGARNEGSVILRRRGILVFIYFAYRALRGAFKANCSIKARWSILSSIISAIIFRYNIELPEV